MTPHQQYRMKLLVGVALLSAARSNGGRFVIDL